MQDKIIDTSMVPDDSDLEIDSKGLTPVVSPADQTWEETEDDDALEALMDDLSPGEAARVLEDMRPLSKEERKLLDDEPLLADLTRVDDAEQEQFIINQSRKGYNGMDDVLDDAVYGDAMQDELGFSFKKIGRSIGRGVKRGVRTVRKAPMKGLKKIAKGMKKFVPSRDRGKAQIVKNLHRKLTVKHANWLAVQDKKAGRPVQPRSAYLALSKAWSKDKIQKGGLPVSFAMGRDEILGADIIGSDVMGSWWNPFSWFRKKSQQITDENQSELSDEYADGQMTDESMSPTESYPQEAYPQQAYPQEAYPQESYPQEAYEESEYMEGDAFVGEGDDSLGAVATEILSGITVAPKAPTKEDELIAIAVMKLQNRKPLSAGELAVVSSLAQKGHPKAKRLYALLFKEGKPVDSSGAWLHKANPLYWLKSAEERKLIDIERQKWIENADRQKDLEKRQKVLTQAERAKSATEAVEAAKAQAAATEAQLQAIKSSLSGELIRDLKIDFSGMGHEKPTAVSKVVASALQKTGNLDKAQTLYGKIARGETLTPSELQEARKIGKALGKVKVVHGDLMGAELSAVHHALRGSTILGNLDRGIAHSQKCGKAADHLSQKMASGAPLSNLEKQAARKLITDSKGLRKFTKSHVSGDAFVGLDNASSLRRSAIIGAAKVMSPAEKKMLLAITNLAKAGNPRAKNALAQLKKSGDIMGGDVLGLSMTKAFKYATAPVWLPAKYAAKGVAKTAKWTGQQLGIVKKGSSPEQVRLAKMRAAAKRRAAAAARARAADAQTAAELRAQESIASAADAEADAADAEALAKEAAMRTAEAEADPEQGLSEDDSSGAFVGSWNAFVGDDSGADEIIGADKKKFKDPFDADAPYMKKVMKEKALIAKAASKDATGVKIRAGAALYAKAKKGDPKAKAALATMTAKAKKNDPQAIRDIRAVKAGKLALKAKRKAQKKEARMLARAARKSKVIAFQKKVEAATANKLARVERKHQLRKLAKVERKAATGNPKARAYVAKQVALAKSGDKGAQKRVEAMKLAKTVRVAAPNKREKRNLVLAQRLVVKARKGNPKAVRQVRLVEAAAKAGNPNAKRALKRLALAAAVTGTVATGVVMMPGKKGRKVSAQSNKEVLARTKAKLEAGSITREELAAGAKAASALGDKKTAGKLAVAASKAPSATETLKRTATVVAAKETGNPAARATIMDNLELAKKGDPEAIKKTANVVAVQTIDDINKGRPVSQTMQDAINLNERIVAKDPAAIAEAQAIQKAATAENPMPEATMAATALAAAAITGKALAAKPKAKAEYLARVNPPLEGAAKTEAEAQLAAAVSKANDGTITAEEGITAVRIAERLGKPKIAAEISAKAPPYINEAPLSTLPDMPLPPINGVWGLLKESVKALTFSTRDPLANYRGGVAGRAKQAVAVEPVSSSGWSPFGIFKKFARNASIIAPATGIVASAASLAMALEAKKKAGQKTVVAPVAQAPVAAPAQAPAPVAPTAKAEISDESGAEKGDDVFKKIIGAALKTKKITKSDFNKAIASKKVKDPKKLGAQVLDFLLKEKVKVEA